MWALIREFQCKLIIMADWLSLTQNLGSFDYFPNFTIMLSIFLLPSGSFVKKTTKSYHRIIDNVYIAGSTATEVLVKDLKPGAVIWGLISSLLYQTKDHAPKQICIWLANAYLFCKRVSFWNKNPKQYLVSVPNTLYLSPCLLCFLDPTRSILLHVW